MLVRYIPYKLYGNNWPIFHRTESLKKVMADERMPPKNKILAVVVVLILIVDSCASLDWGARDDILAQDGGAELAQHFIK